MNMLCFWSLLGALALTFCAALIWRRGLLPLLHVPSIVLQRPLFVLLRDGVEEAKRRLRSILRLGMLLFLNLEEEDQDALRQGLSPRVRERLSQPVGDLLPRWLRRILLGPQVSGHDEAVERPNIEKPQMEKAETVDKEPPPPEEVETLFAAWTLGVYARLVQLTCRGVTHRAKFWASHGAKMRRLLCAPSLLNSALVSFGCGSVGCIAGGCVGGLCGLPCALFTFGLSIPFGALVGSSVGGCGGLAAGVFVSAACKEVLTNGPPKQRLTPR
eukprot:symbB.v1.2.030319.t1/scaffold3397.1/size57701/2